MNLRPITIMVTPLVERNVEERARKLGYKPSDYVRMLFEAAYAARVGQERELPATDVELDEQVRLVMCLAGQADHASISKATGVRTTLVAAIFEGFSILRAGKAVVREARSLIAGASATPTDAQRSARGTKRGDEKIDLIRRMWSDGHSAAEIAAATGSTTGSIYQFAKNNRVICPVRR